MDHDAAIQEIKRALKITRELEPVEIVELRDILMNCYSVGLCDGREIKSWETAKKK
jgi:hypothetical protein